MTAAADLADAAVKPEDLPAAAGLAAHLGITTPGDAAAAWRMLGGRQRIRWREVVEAICAASPDAPEPGSGGQAAYEVWRAAVPDFVCNVPGGPWEDLSPAVQAGFTAIAAQQPQAAAAVAEIAHEQRKPGSELAEAMRESRARGEILQRLAAAFTGPDGSETLRAVVTVKTLTQMLTDAGVPADGRPVGPSLAGQVSALKRLVGEILDDYETDMRLELTPERRAKLARYRERGGLT